MKKLKGRSQIEIRKAGGDEYYFIFKLPSDGIFISKFFEDAAEAASAAEKTKRNAMDERFYLCRKETGNQFYFAFNFRKNLPIGQSSVYKDELSMDSGMQYMKRYLVEAEIVDLTS